MTDEGHIRDALLAIERILDDLSPPDSNYRTNPDRWPNGEKNFVDLRKHIDAIRVRGDSKREAQADGTPE